MDNPSYGFNGMAFESDAQSTPLPFLIVIALYTFSEHCIFLKGFHVAITNVLSSLQENSDWTLIP